jgi:hypothetical protein
MLPFAGKRLSFRGLHQPSSYSPLVLCFSQTSVDASAGNSSSPSLQSIDRPFSAPPLVSCCDTSASVQGKVASPPADPPPSRPCSNPETSERSEPRRLSYASHPFTLVLHPHPFHIRPPPTRAFHWGRLVTTGEPLFPSPGPRRACLCLSAGTLAPLSRASKHRRRLHPFH